MTKRIIKVIKRGDGAVNLPTPAQVVKRRKKKEPTVAETIKGWIDERRENNDAEDRSREKQLAAWDADPNPVTPAKAS